MQGLFCRMARGCGGKVVLGLSLAALLAAGCAHPTTTTAKRLGLVGLATAAAGGGAWAVGDRADNNGVMVPGMIALGAGVVMIIAAGVMMASVVDCEADADCPGGQKCRQVPAGAGRLPYSQCVAR